MDVDGKPRWRYAPGEPLAHSVIDKGIEVEVIGPFDRFKKKA